MCLHGMDRADFTCTFTISNLLIYQCFVQTTTSHLCCIVTCCDETKYISLRMYVGLIGFPVGARWCMSLHFLVLGVDIDHLIIIYLQ